MATRTRAAPVLMPHNTDAERAVLASIFDGATDPVDDGAVLRIVADEAQLKPSHFYHDAHATIYRTMLMLRAHQTPPDLLIVCDALESEDKLEEVGGASYISELTTRLPTSLHVRHYADIVKRDAINRASINLGKTIFDAGWHNGDLSDELVRWREELDDLVTDAKPTDAGRFRLRSVRDMLNQPRPEPLIDHHLSLNSTGILYGPSGVGKSVLLLDMMAHVALGWAWQGHAVTSGAVVYVCAEGQVYMPERLQAWMSAHHVEDIPNLHIIDVAPQLLEPATVPDLLASLTAQLPEMPVWIVFDTISQTSEGADENDPSEMRDYTRALARIREATHAHVLAVHHTGKDEAKGYRGASSLKGNVDTMIEIAKQGAGAVMHCEKQRGGWSEFRDFSYRVQKLALDEFADRTGPIIEAVEAAEIASPTSDLLDSDEIALGALLGHPDGVAAGAWCRAALRAGVKTERTFYNARDRLITRQFAVRNGDAYFITPNGARSLKMSRFSTEIAATGTELGGGTEKSPP